MFFTKNPTERVLGESVCVANGRIVRKRDYCFDIPLLDSLQCQLRSDTIRVQVCRYRHTVVEEPKFNRGG